MTKMKTLKVLLAFGLALSFSGPAYAACRDGETLKRIGSTQTASANITDAGQDVQAIAIDCGGSACLAGLYDSDSVADVGVAKLVLEVGDAANGMRFLDLTDTPLYFRDGITFIDNAQTDAITLFGCEPR